MKLTIKFIIALTCVICTVLSVSAFVRIKREVALLEDDTHKDNILLGRALAGAVGRIWTTVGEVEALDLIEDADERESHVSLRWIWMDDDPTTQGPFAPEAWQLLARGRTAVSKGPSAGEAGMFFYTYVPVSLPGGRLAAIELRESMDARRLYVRRTILQAVVASSVMVLVCALLAAGLGIAFVGRPVRSLVYQARRIGAGDLSPPAEGPKSRDEIGELAFEMNAMRERLIETRESLEAEIATRLATQEQLRHADRLTTVGKLAAGIAHEVGTPLNVITGHAQLIRDEYPQGSTAHDSVAIVTEQAHRVTAIIRQLLDFSRQRTPKKESLDLGAIALQVVSLLDSLASEARVHLEPAVGPEQIRAMMDPGQIQQVVTNLVVNGIQSMTGGGVLHVGIQQRRRRPPGQAAGDEHEFGCLYVEDSGHGIPKDALLRIFEPFFTTKEVGEGTGLGLSVAYGIVQEHSGWIEVQSELGKGSRFTVYLPLEDFHDQ